MATKTILFHIPLKLGMRFKAKLATDNVKLRSWGNAVVDQYLNGLVIIPKETTKTNKS